MKKFLMSLVILSLIIASGVFAATGWVEQTAPLGTIWLNDVVMVSPAIAVAVGPSATVIRTTDYGATWASSNTGIEPDDEINAICSDPNTATTLYVVGEDIPNGESNVYKSTNSGASWTKISTVANCDFKGISFGTSSVGYVCGNTGFVYKSTDTGANWTPQNNGLGNDVTYLDIFAVDASNVFVTSRTDRTYYTTDGGTNWNQSNLGPNYSGEQDVMYDLFFISSTVGWGVGDPSIALNNGVITNCTDPTAQWTEQTSGKVVPFRGVYLLDANTGYAVGGGGNILITSNGGTAWLDDSSGADPINDNFFDVDFFDSTNGYAVGNDGSAAIIFRKSYDPTVTAVNPTQVGRGVTNYNLTVTGTDFQDGCVATVTDIPGTITVNSTIYNSPTSLTINVDVPSDASTGAVWDITVTNPNSKAGTGSNLLTVNNIPTISSIDLNGKTSRYPGWNGSFTITGTNFLPGATLAFADPANINVTGYSIASSTSITGTLTVTSSATAGNYTFTVNNGDGNSVASTLTVDPTMIISDSGLTPSTVNLGATVSMTISGSNFGSGITVSDIVFIKGLVNSITTLNSNSIVISFTAPSAGTGTGDLTITNDNGEVKTATACLTITDPTVTPPSITSLSKSSGTQGETLSLDINGANFVTNPTVSFSGSGISVNSTTYNSSSSLTISIAIAADATVGLRTLIVDNNNGGLASYGNALSVISSGGGTAPTINSGNPIIPNFGIKQTSSSSSSSGLSTFAITGDDEQSYAINGSNFGADMSVSFASSSPATTSIMAPPAVPIPSQITVRTNADGTQQIIFFLNDLTVPLGFYDILIVDSSTGLSASRARAFEVKDPVVVAANLPAAKAYPSPADPETAGSIRLQFEMAESVDNVYIWIYDISGAEVQKIGPINTIIGNNTTEWNFIRIDGLKVGDGIYVFKVGTGNRTFTSGKFAVHRPKRN